MTTTCLATGEWDKNPEEIDCRNEPSEFIHAVQLSMAILNVANKLDAHRWLRFISHVLISDLHSQLHSSWRALQWCYSGL